MSVLFCERCNQRHDTDFEVECPRCAAVDWNGKLYVRKPLPRDRMFWVVTDEGEAHEVAYSADAEFWTGRELYFRQDGESGSWGPDEILGWTDSADDAHEAADLLPIAGA